MVAVFKYKNINVKDLGLKKPTKNTSTGVYFSEISMNSTSNSEKATEEFLVQTPKNSVYNENKLTFVISKNEEFFTFIESIKTRIVEILYNNSEKFFKGKKFTEDYIYRSIESPLDLCNENLKAFINIDTVVPNMVFYDHFKDKLDTPPELPWDGTFLLKFENISFIKRKIKINISINSMRMSPPKIVNDKCYLLDEETLQEVENSQEAAETLQETEEAENSQEVETEEVEVETSQETEKDEIENTKEVSQETESEISDQDFFM